jgi:flagellar protein FliO/FliZ
VKPFAGAAFAVLFVALLPVAALAADAPPAPLGAGSLLQVLVGLAVVLALLLGGAVLLRRLGRIPGLSNQAIRTVAAASVGTRERVVLLEVADQWVLIGVAPGQVRPLATLPKGQLPAAPEPGPTAPGFAQVLQRFKERRDAR